MERPAKQGLYTTIPGRQTMATMTNGKSKARYIMIGGFLSAAKTTAVGKLARRPKDQGTRVGLITTDQGRNLVDTAILRSQAFATEEIPGGCFCRRQGAMHT